MQIEMFRHLTVVHSLSTVFKCFKSQVYVSDFNYLQSIVFDSFENRLIEIGSVQDSRRSGRPTITTNQYKALNILSDVQENLKTLLLSCQGIMTFLVCNFEKEIRN